MVSRSQLDAFYPDRLLIRDARHWHVDDVTIGGESVVAKFWGPHGVDAPTLVSAWNSGLVRIVPMGPGEEMCVKVRYDGPVDGDPFEACVVGAADAEDPSPWVESPASVYELRADAASQACRPDGAVTLRAPPRDGEFYPRRLVIEDASRWVVNDVCVRGASILVQAGDLPGSMFSELSGTPPLDVGSLAPGDEFSVAATYVGGEPSATLRFSLIGTASQLRPHARAVSAFLPMSSGVDILPCSSAQISSRPHWRHVPRGSAFQAEQVVIGGARDWIVDDLRVGVHSQLAASGYVPGDAFAADADVGPIRLTPVRAGIDLVMSVSYDPGRNYVARVGAASAPFICGFAGNVVLLDRRPEGIA